MIRGLQMNKVPEFGRPHNFRNCFSIPVESAAARNSTIYPLITQDEGLGAISAYESNPQNAAFVEVPSHHCFPTSRVNSIFSQMDVSMSKIMLETDKVHHIKFATSLIHTSFNEGAQALDEISTLDLQEICELTSESTDRQTYPLYNNVSLHDYKLNSKLDLGSETQGLTTLEIEGVAFNLAQYYDCLQYLTNGPKLRTMMTPLRWHTLTRNQPNKTLYFKQQANTKYMNPYTFLGILIHVPTNAENEQYGEVGDTTVETSVLHFSTFTRYMEHNHEYNHSLL